MHVHLINLVHEGSHLAYAVPASPNRKKNEHDHSICILSRTTYIMYLDGKQKSIDLLPVASVPFDRAW